MGLSVKKVKEIHVRTNGDLMAVASFISAALTNQKRMMTHAVQSSVGNELYSRRESPDVSQQILHRRIQAAEFDLFGEDHPGVSIKTTAAMSKNNGSKASRTELETRIKELEDTNLLLRAECDNLKNK